MTVNNCKINATEIMNKDRLKHELYVTLILLFTDCHSKRKMFETFYKFAESITNVVLWIYLFIVTYTAKIFYMIY